MWVRVQPPEPVKYRRLLKGYVTNDLGTLMWAKTEHCHGLCDGCVLRYTCYTAPSGEELMVTNVERFNATLVQTTVGDCTYVRSVNDEYFYTR